MSVEIFILSGARAGQQIVLGSTEFRVGDDPHCEVYFDPQQDLPAKGRSAQFRLMDDGWFVSSTGAGELLINQEVVSQRTRIRSGDVLRMSSEGPDFTFSIVSRTAVAARGGPVGVSNKPPASQPPHPASVRPPLPAREIAGPAQTSAAPLPVAQGSAQPTADPGNSTRKTRLVLWASLLGGGLAIIMLLACIAYSFMPSSPGPASGEEAAKAGTNEGHATDERKRILKKAQEDRLKAQQEKKAQDEKTHRRLEQEAWKKREPPKSEP